MRRPHQIVTRSASDPGYHAAALAADGTTTSARLRRRTDVRAAQVRFAIAVVGFVVLVLFLGFAFAGSPARLADGTRIAGIDVGGLSPQDARSLLERRAQRLATVPVSFTAGS